MRAALGLVIVSCLSCGGCSKKPQNTEQPTPDKAWLEGAVVPESPAQKPSRGGTLTVRVAVEPTGFSRIHDQQAEGTMVRYITGTVYETLGRLDPQHPEGELLPSLADSWTQLGAVLTVALKRGVQFHDGSPFTCADLAAVIAAIRDPAHLTVAMRTALGPIESVECVDDLTLRVKWTEPSIFTTRALLGSVPAMPSEALVGDFDTLPIHRAPIGTGPFRFSAFEPGNRLVLTRVDGPRATAFLDQVIIRFVKDDTVALSLWEQGAFDLFTRIPPATWRAIEKLPWAVRDYRRLRFDENAYGWIGWNRQRPVFDDVRVRRALAMLYPAEAISKAVELGLEVRTTCPFFRTSASCDPSIVPLPYDPPAAKALLDEAGWKDLDGDGLRERNGVPLAFSFLMVSSSQRLGKVLPLFQEQLVAAGVKLALEPVDAAQSIARMRTHDFDAAAMSWSNPDALQDQFDLFHSSQIDGGKNSVAISSPRLDALLTTIRHTANPVERAGLERQLHRLLFDDQVYLFLTARPSLDAAKRRVHGLSPSLAWYDLSKVWVDP